jgi:hypothetical protein
MSDDQRNDPSVWMLLLERGRRTGDFEMAAKAKHELERLGIFITYRKPKREKAKPERGSDGP